MPSRIQIKLVVLALAALSPLIILADRLVPKRPDLWVFGLGRPNQRHGNAQNVWHGIPLKGVLYTGWDDLATYTYTDAGAAERTIDRILGVPEPDHVI